MKKIILIPCCALMMYGASSWLELDKTGQGSLDLINVSAKDTVLRVNLNSATDLGTSRYGGSLVLESGLWVDILSITGVINESATSLYILEGSKNRSIEGNGTFSVNIRNISTEYIKSLFDIRGRGQLSIDTKMAVMIPVGASLFSIFRIAGGGRLVFNNDLNIDVSHAKGSLGGKYRSIFDLNAGGNVQINPDQTSNAIYLKGDIFSQGTLEGNFKSTASLFEGKMRLENDSITTLQFFSSKMSSEIEASGQSSIDLSLDSSTLQGSLQSRDNAILDLKLANHSSGEFNIMSEQNANFITLSTQSQLKSTIQTSGNTIINVSGGSSYEAEITLQNKGSVQASIIDENSLLKGWLKANLNTESKLTFTQRAKGEFDTSLSDEARVEFKITSGAILHGNLEGKNFAKGVYDLLEGSLKGEIKLVNNAQTTMSLKHNSLFQGKIDVEDSAKVKITQEYSTIKADLIMRDSGEKLEYYGKQGLFEGKINLMRGGSENKIEWSGMKANFEMFVSDFPKMSLSATQDSTLKAKVHFSKTQEQKIHFSLENSKIYGTFIQENPIGGTLSLNNQSQWLIGENSTLKTLEIANQNIVDFQFEPFSETKRALDQINLNNRILLKVDSIKGDGGIFKLHGVLNRASWGKDERGKTLATDQIQTRSLEGRHHIQIFWNPNNLDQTLLQANLYDDYIVVASQSSTAGGGEFVGAKSSLGVFEYDTKLTKIELKNEAGEVVGYDWILGVKKEDPLPPDPPIPPDPPPPDPPPPDPIPPDPVPPDPPIQPVKPNLSTSARVINSLLSSQFKLFLAQEENLHTRLGDLRSFNALSGAWLKYRYGLMLSLETLHSTDSLEMYSSIALGSDYNFFTPSGRNFLGLSFEVMNFWDFGGGIQVPYFKGDSVLYGLSVYDSFLFDHGLYIDAYLKYYFSQNAFDLFYMELEGNKKSFNTHGLIMSIEAGKKFRLPIMTPDFQRSFYYLKPEGKITLGYLPSFKMEFASIANYNFWGFVDDSLPLYTSLSVDFGRRFDGDQIKGDVFVGAGIEYTFHAGGGKMISTSFNQVHIDNDDNFNLKIRAGGNLLINDVMRMYFGMDTRFGGKIQPLLNLSVGMRFLFGKITSKVPQSFPMIYAP
ncbi:autotransporter outer membrane beta-barrel domain-containing protein [Helicobacter pametensis]|uniref:autotransporter outer membrane beta-barrel domain-containing protein n=1 Tax=Helicobacter pametensis TaxID=95149 RepID=UPI00048090CB|nr:autotransporter outer membrane beta-barrel domain-containing protein [Helicobacter pametensis]